jgi:DNA-binding NarL/FixJ family response regulator
MFQMPDHPTRALLIEDIPQYQRILTRILAGTNIQLDSSSLLAEGISKAKELIYDVVLLDLGLPDSQGLLTYTTFHHHFPSLPVIILSVTEDQQLASQAVQNGAQDYLVKGSYLLNDTVGKDILCRAISYAIERNKIKEVTMPTRSKKGWWQPQLRQADQSLASELAMPKSEFIANASKISSA